MKGSRNGCRKGFLWHTRQRNTAACLGGAAAGKAGQTLGWAAPRKHPCSFGILSPHAPTSFPRRAARKYHPSCYASAGAVYQQLLQARPPAPSPSRGRCVRKWRLLLAAPRAGRRMAGKHEGRRGLWQAHGSRPRSRDTHTHTGLFHRLLPAISAMFSPLDSPSVSSIK